MTNAESAKMLPYSVSVVVPVYNSEATLGELTTRIGDVLTPIVQRFEIILVNDGSRDGSWQVVTGLVKQAPEIRGLNLMHNYGQHHALLAGVHRAQYEVIVTIDDDLQHPPEEIPELLSKLSEGYDVVYGRPAERNHSAWRNTSSRILKAVLKVVLGAEMGSHSSAFRAFWAILCRGFVNFTDAQLSIDVLLSWSVSRVTHIPVEHHARRVGKSGYTFRKLMLLAFNMLTGYSTLPLRLASGAGLLTSLVGLAMFFYVVVRRLLQASPVPGFAWIASEIALFAGMQLFAIGVIGEYVARLHFRTMGKPPYVIREEVGNDVLAMAEPQCIIRQEIGSDVLSQ
jgi:glycosyltransferase involved in cell wall biosynthesis